MSFTRRRNMVAKDHKKLSVVRQCALLKISRSGLYYKRRGMSDYKQELTREIDRVFLEYPFFGVRQMRRYLASIGYCVSVKRVRRLMRLMGLMPIYQRPKTSVANPEHRRYPYLLRDVAINRSNQVWCADITYIPMRKGFLYLVAIMDWHSRKVLSWRLSITMDVDFCVSALEEALSKYGCPDIFNTDQGSQFTSFAFTDILKRKGIRISMDGRGRYMDNIFIERLWRSLKYENVYINAYETGGEARKGIGQWINFYNNTRPHSRLNGLTPERCYEANLPMVA